MEYEYRYKITEEEYKAFYVYTGWSAPWLKAHRRKQHVSFFLYMALYCWALLVTIRSIDGKQKLITDSIIVGTLVGAIVGASLTSYSAINRQKKLVGRLLQEDDNKDMLAERVLLLEDDYISISYKEGMSKLNWSGIKRFAVTPDAFYLITGSLTGYIIPKRILSSQEEINALEQFLLQKIAVTASMKSL